MSKENRSTIPYCILNLRSLVPFWTIMYHLSAWWSWPWQHIYFNTCELLKFIEVMYGDCMLVGCRLRRERTEFKASLYGIETQCPLERNSLPLEAVMVIVCALHSPVQSERQWVLQHTFVLSLRMEKSHWLCSPLFCMSAFLTLAIEFRKKQASLNLLKGKNDFLKIIIR